MPRLEGLALLLVHFLRHLDLDSRQHVAPTFTVQVRHAAALDAQELAVLRAGGDLQLHRPVGRRRLDLAAERCSGVRHGDVDDQIVTPALVDLRRLDARDHVEVAGGRPAVTGLALALEPDPSPVLDARGNLDRVALRAALAPAAVAGRARLLDD
jgi:hypothetical protein